MGESLNGDSGPNGTHLSVGWALLVIFALALTLRCLVLFELRDSALLEVALGDGRQYQAWASEIAAGDWLGHEVFYQAPLYPYFMAVLFKLFGPQQNPLLLTQAVLGAASCVLLAMAGRRFFSRNVGLIAGALLAFYPPAIFFDALVQKTALALFLTSALLALLGEISRQPQRLWLIFTGAVLGCLTLTRENALILAPVLVAWIWLGLPGTTRQRWARVGLFTLGLCLVLLPVGMRNLAIGGRFLVTTSQMGPNFFIGNNLDADGRYRPLRAGRQDARVEREDATELAEQALGRRLSPGEVSSYWFGRALDYIRSKPWHWARLLVTKSYLLVNRRELVDSQSIETHCDHSRLLATLARLLTFGVIGPLAILGVCVTRSHWRRLWVLYVFSAAVAVSLVLFYVMARYRLSLVPVAVIFAAVGLLALRERWSRRSWRELGTSIAVLAAAAVVQNAPLTIATSPRATTYYNLGVALFEQGDDMKARANFEKALGLMPSFADGHLGLGRVLAVQGDISGAIHHLEEATRIDPRHADAHYHLGRMLTHQARLSEALEHYEKVLAIDPRHAPALHHLGYLLMSTGALDEAADHLRQALEVDPHLAMARNLLANILAEQGQRAEAIELYEQALETDATLVDAHFKLGLLLSDDGRPEQARRHFEDTVRLRPDFADGHLGLAGALETLGARAEAARHYRQVLQLRQDDAVTMIRLARLLATAPEREVRDVETAVGLAERACQGTSFRDPQMLEVLFAACTAAEDPDRAIDPVRRAAAQASEAGNEEQARLLRQRLELYEAQHAARGRQ